MLEDFAPTRASALARIAAVRPAAYARTRNALDGAVSGLSPYITHGFVTLPEVLAGVAERHAIEVGHKFVYELGWRDYFRHVWHQRGDAILKSLRQGPLPDEAYLQVLPADIRHGRTGVPVVDQAVRSVYASGTLHNHARMWLASYVVHIRKVYWRAGADWLYSHLLDGDLASNHLSWQWVAGTGSSKPYLFNADNVARYSPPSWHSPGSVIDNTYEALDRIARQPIWEPGALLEMDRSSTAATMENSEPPLLKRPPLDLGLTAPDGSAVAGREVWLVHPWSLGTLPASLPDETLVVGVFLADFHRDWPWSEQRWRFVGQRMAELTDVRWYADAAAISAALQTARRVRSIDEPHLAPWLSRLAQTMGAPMLFPTVSSRCDSFSQWWTRATRGLNSAADLLSAYKVPAW